MDVFDRLALFLFFLIGVLEEPRIVLANGVYQLLMFRDFILIEGIGLGHSLEDYFAFLVLFIMNGGQVVDMFDFVVDDSFELVDDFLEVLRVVDVVEVEIEHGVVKLLG